MLKTMLLQKKITWHVKALAPLTSSHQIRAVMGYIKVSFWCSNIHASKTQIVSRGPRAGSGVAPGENISQRSWQTTGCQ